MKKRILRLTSCILIAAMTVVCMSSVVEQMAWTVSATSISDVQNQINETKNSLNSLNEKIAGLSDEQDLVQEKIDDLNAEIINMMASIQMKEEEIEEKETELDQKQVEINQAEEAYEEAKAAEEKQYADMLIRIRYMYENGNSTYLSLFLAGDGLKDMLNHMDYVEAIYEYDRTKLEEFQALKQQVRQMWDALELEKSQLQTQKEELLVQEENLKNQKASLDTMLAQKKRESANYDAEIKKYQQEAAVAKKQLQQEQQILKKLQAQANKPASNAANGNYTSTNYTSTIDNASGSDLGKKVAKYACQYIGNPYVAGGTSLTNGADCSGFTYRVYSDFGYSLPRTSYEQRSAGTGVDYANAQPGDLICYDGHVALYIGGGMIVHAS
nr:C40 family peptidase [Acetatifactor sp.]